MNDNILHSKVEIVLPSVLLTANTETVSSADMLEMDHQIMRQLMSLGFLRDRHDQENSAVLSFSCLIDTSFCC